MLFTVGVPVAVSGGVGLTGMSMRDKLMPPGTLPGCLVSVDHHSIFGGLCL